ncbi:ornithine decarboxylase-like isoform X1 [Haliotis rufescens]|uniref:ornithine decarboxylase-like isoform X1 n=2 Tax=Haliotis rufescens TaxID=6454 RepID=UPI00201F1679|nr:ornithine decarboxylase-like isoform X1 [Haliotis rufescens]
MITKDCRMKADVTSMGSMVLYEDGEDIKDKINRVITQEREKDEYYEDAFITIDMDDVIKQLKQWRKYLPRVEPYFAIKSNNDPKILSLLADLGVFFDCASRNEMASILDLGVEPSSIVYSHSVKCLRDMRYAAAKGVDLMAFDNEHELVKVKSLHPKARLLLRIKASDKYEVQHRLSVQYGCDEHEVRSLLAAAKTMGLNVVGISFHVGSGILDGRVFTDAIERADRAFTIASELNISLSVLDVGGGFFGHKAFIVKFIEVAGLLNSALEGHFPVKRGVQIIAEPGRYFVSSCATLVVSVIGKRLIQDGVEEESLYFVNDSVFGTFNDTFTKCSQAKLPSLLKAPRSDETFKSSVWGHTCAGDDCLFKDCYLPDLEIGDRLFVENVGAYPMSMAKGRSFNGMPQPIPIHVCSKNIWKSHYCKPRGKRHVD